MINSITTTMKLSLVIFAIYLQSASTQQTETETETHHDLAESLDLCRVAKRSFIGACVFMFMFFCLKKYSDYRAKQIVAENPGPFGAMSDISVYDMTLFQKQAVLEVLFTDDKCLRFQKVCIKIPRVLIVFAIFFSKTSNA